MQEMIELNAEAERMVDEDSTNFRYVTALLESGESVLGGPAQFGYDFKKGQIVGKLAKGKFQKMTVFLRSFISF